MSLTPELLERVMHAKQDTIRQLNIEFAEHQSRVESIFNSFIACLTSEETETELQLPLTQSPPLSGAENNDEFDIPLNLVTQKTELDGFATNDQNSHVQHPLANSKFIPASNSAFSVYTKPQENPNCTGAVKKEIADNFNNETFLPPNDIHESLTSENNNINQQKIEFDIQPQSVSVEKNNTMPTDGRIETHPDNQINQLNSLYLNCVASSHSKGQTILGKRANENVTVANLDSATKRHKTKPLKDTSKCVNETKDLIEVIELDDDDEDVVSLQQDEMNIQVKPLTELEQFCTLTDLSNETTNQTINDKASTSLNEYKDNFIVNSDKAKPKAANQDSGRSKLSTSVLVDPRLNKTRSLDNCKESTVQYENFKLQDRKPTNIPFDVDIVSIKCFKSGCNATFSIKRQQNQHMRDAHNILPIVCPLAECNRSFHDKGEWTKHAVDDHSGVTQWECAICGMDWHSFNSLYTHALINHQEGHYKCSIEVCNFEANLRGPVIDHYRRNHEYVIKNNEHNQTKLDQVDKTETHPDDKFTCIKLNCPAPSCNAVFENMRQYGQHKADIHNIYQYRCLVDKCGKSFKTSEEKNAHWTKDHQDISNWRCHHCNRQLKDCRAFNEHMFLSHTEGVFGCTEKGCHFKDKTRMSIIKHYDQTHLNQSNSIANNQAKYSLPDKAPTKKPIRFKELYVDCIQDGCMSVFSSGKVQYNRHLLSAHAIHPYSCLLANCKQSFDSIDCLKQHIKVDHNDPIELYCVHCSDNKFYDYALLYKHWTLFHQEGLFACISPNCQFQSTYRIDVIKHHDAEHHEYNHV